MLIIYVHGAVFSLMTTNTTKTLRRPETKCLSSLTALASRCDLVCVRVDTGRGTTFGVLGNLGLFYSSFCCKTSRYIWNPRSRFISVLTWDSRQIEFICWFINCYKPVWIPTYTLCKVQIYVARIIRERNIKYPLNLLEHRHFLYSMIFIQPNNHQNKKNVRHIIFKIQV